MFDLKELVGKDVIVVLHRNKRDKCYSGRLDQVSRRLIALSSTFSYHKNSRLRWIPRPRYHVDYVFVYGDKKGERTDLTLCQNDTKLDIYQENKRG